MSLIHKISVPELDQTRGVQDSFASILPRYEKDQNNWTTVVCRHFIKIDDFSDHDSEITLDFALRGALLRQRRKIDEASKQSGRTVRASPNGAVSIYISGLGASYRFVRISINPSGRRGASRGEGGERVEETAGFRAGSRNNDETSRPRRPTFINREGLVYVGVTARCVSPQEYHARPSDRPSENRRL